MTRPVRRLFPVSGPETREELVARATRERWSTSRRRGAACAPSEPPTGVRGTPLLHSISITSAASPFWIANIEPLRTSRPPASTRSSI